MHPTHDVHVRLTSTLPRLLCAAAIALLVAGCTGGPESVQNPAEVLNRSGQSREHYFDAIEAARLRGVDDASRAALRRMLAAYGYAIDARERAFALLYDTDPKAVTAALENSLPRMGDIAWRERVCALVASRLHRAQGGFPKLLQYLEHATIVSKLLTLEHLLFGR